MSATDINSWYPVLVSYAGGALSSRNFADEVYEVLASGTSKILPGGEKLILPAEPAAAMPGAERMKRSISQDNGSDAQAENPTPECPA
ncbi:hypothetical protein ODZ83_08825 [Acaricomes phytoseiuli]|uniref:hypothetical protein n=1 Tax=Acaricomes phytoseiuli TaxID=291968 RepID=UPI0022217A0D|nr:hypothetical protein [Acaricomes phytoseiuli]MCW1250278.1 hypothetical protein [Acaricomes phytoseiuli]